MRYRATVVWICGLLLAVPSAFGQQEKLAQTGMKFLSVSVNARAAGMGDAMTALEGGSAMMFYNPAGMAYQQTFANVAFGQAQWISDIDYNFGSFSLRPAGGRFGVFGFSVVAIDYGTFLETIRFDNEQGYLDLGEFSPTALSVGAGYARSLTDRFAIGAHVKYALQDLGDSVVELGENEAMTRQDNREGVVAFDFGMLYKTGFRSLNFAVSARNFAQEIEYEEESFQLPLTLLIGLSMDVMDLMAPGSGSHALLVSVDAENPRDFSEQIKIGAEYLFLSTFALRAGYVFPTDEQGINLGAGFRQELGSIGIGIDYAYTDFGIFSEVHRLALQLSF
ncbi:MAG TPA: PorV/PorQ family protein [Rhodothermales bacterium]|nr:PorV/PorQ family protein [Rhodothermales bacterium]